ncbi:hypothetical protein I6L73_13455 [Klebsiella quasipneumoniae]|uniref:hypothetical protein n=1 Tax=Klebsiella quasipneumoniae TaxID=1463165 RepID=UPI00109D20FA|nr:hypothetical protein [Klebsiella quasipneumoniae]MBL4366499.1 hypothetical protein [Klebsiella quasipneumoniae]MCW4604800.1 hypothetical protein [Klebsiella quasipneumoniae]MCW4618591.1 hypothetical protein [Klebsiella quasipneumoniae]QNC79253.1 hypothetical protein F3137_12030 [Klebsiella quasipneumoniae]QXA81221.1 hypothetical protein I6L73_13455 [Klebsiella quasipneumoniae]
MSQQKIVLQPLLRVWLGLFSGLLLVNRRAPRPLTHLLPPLLLLLAGLAFFFLRPDVIPGGETTVYRYGERERYYQTVRWQKPEPGAWRGTRSEYKVYIEYRDPKGYRKADNIKNAYTCETHRESRFFTLTTEEDWYPDAYPNILDAPCQAIKDPQAMTEYTRDHARWFPIMF